MVPQVPGHENTPPVDWLSISDHPVPMGRYSRTATDRSREHEEY